MLYLYNTTNLLTEEVKDMEITEGAVGGIEITDGGADTDGSVRADNVMEGEMEEESTMLKPEMHCISTSVLSSALSELKKRACELSFRLHSMLHTRGHGCSSSSLLFGSENDVHGLAVVILCLTVPLGLESDSGSGLGTRPTVSPALNTHIISMLVRRCGGNTACASCSTADRASAAAWTPQSRCASSWVYLETHRGEEGRAIGKAWMYHCWKVGRSREEEEGEQHHRDELKHTPTVEHRTWEAESGGRRADKVVGAREATERKMLPDHGRHARSAVRPLVGSLNDHPEVVVLAPRVGCFGAEIAVILGAASREQQGDIAKGYQREAEKPGTLYFSIEISYCTSLDGSNGHGNGSPGIVVVRFLNLIHLTAITRQQPTSLASKGGALGFHTK
ncbi:hypothetical protein B0H16DRAFT_1468269 [Mycena metata]|uniref:Uncharacterized protein n=1 Tax=Mycena metata TaxID=1033252 RepID=A0AAD7I1H0_9AGAR|nr:hypothetical protein B0H16DRAFT_1468269 [Mycena metata]